MLMRPVPHTRKSQKAVVRTLVSLRTRILPVLPPPPMLELQ